MNESLTHQGVRRPGEFRTNRLGIGGWVVGGRYPIERYLYTLHRISGLAILAYFFAHIIVTTMRLRGADFWDSLMASFGTPLAKTGEFLVFAAFAGVLPFGGIVDAPFPTTTFGYVLSLLKHMVLPVMAWVLGTIPMAIYMSRAFFLIHSTSSPTCSGS